MGLGLRWDGPIQSAIQRFTRVPVSIGGIIIPAGEADAVGVAAADWDEERYPKRRPKTSTLLVQSARTWPSATASTIVSAPPGAARSTLSRTSGL